MSLKQVLKELHGEIIRATNVKETAKDIASTLHQCAGGQITIHVDGKFPGEYPLVGGADSLMPLLLNLRFVSNIFLRGEQYIEFLHKTGYRFSEDEEERKSEEESLKGRGNGEDKFYFNHKGVEFYKRLEESGYYRMKEEREKRLSKAISDYHEMEYGPFPEGEEEPFL